MITNKNESPPHYESLKRQRLRQIQEDYFPPPKKHYPSWFNCTPSHYIPTALFDPAHDDIFSPDISFEIKNSINLSTAIFWGISFSLFLLLTPDKNGSFSESLFFIIKLVFMLLLGWELIRVSNRHPVLTILQEGLLFRKNNLFIPWEHIITTHFYIDADSEYPPTLITDYINTQTDTCKIHSFMISGYDKTLGEISLALTYYQQQYFSLQKKTNLLTETR